MYGFIPFCCILIICSCNTIKTQRYYYDFNKRMLTDKDKGTDEITRPVAYKATKDIQLEVFNYNPLKEEIIIEDSSSQRSIGDTAMLARLIVFPKTLSLPEGDQKNAEIAAKNAVGATTALGINSAQFLTPLVFTTVAEKDDCEMLEAFMYSFNLKKDEIENLILRYKDLMSKMEIIGDDYEYLKNLTTLAAGDVAGRLNSSFLTRLNNFLLPAESVGGTITNTSSRELAGLETQYYTAITDAEAGLDQIKNDADKLKGACAGFFELYKKFSAAVTKVKDNLRDFKNSRADKIVSTFNKKLNMYDELVPYNVGVNNYVSKAVPITKDMHIITIFKKDAGNSTKTQHDYVRIELTRGIKLDVGGGVFVGGLNDHSFSKKSVDSIYTKHYLVNGVKRDTTLSETFTSIYKRDQCKVSYGGMLFLQVHSQNAAWTNWGGYLGFGALFNDQTRWAGSAGISLQLGKPQQFNINVGPIVGQVERLAPPYETNKWYAEKIDNVSTYKAWDVSWMIGFSWSFR